VPKTLAQIQKQIARLEEQANAIRQREVAGVVARIKDAIAHYDLTPADLGFGSGGKAAKPRRKPAKRAARKAGSGKVKYRDDQGNTWTGHGRRPKWFVDALAAGKTAEQLAA
jgi:DNA-binding protein H-NS